MKDILCHFTHGKWMKQNPYVLWKYEYKNDAVIMLPVDM
jgi:hypothetical protein